MSDIKLTVAVPTAGTFRAAFGWSLANLLSYFAAHGVKSRPEAAIAVKIDMQESSVIHTNREQLVRRAIDDGQTHLLFLDDDMVFAPNIADLLLSRRHAVVVCNYLIKTEPEDAAEWVAVTLSGKRLATTEQDTGIVPIAASGFGVSLFDLACFKNTPQPWFLPKFIPEKNEFTTEDYPCFERLREAGATVYLDQDASKLIEHCGSKRWSWKRWTHRADVVPIKKEEAA